MLRLLVLFFFSGCAALIYETVWFYLVQLVVGASSISVAVLLCAFMGGMAIGSWLLTRLTPRGIASLPRRCGTRDRNCDLRRGDSARTALHPTRLPDARRARRRRRHAPRVGVLHRADPADDADGRDAAGDRGRLRQASAGQAREASAVGMLYMANLAGAASGTVLAGFYLLRVHDTVVATAVAVTLERDRRRRVLADGVATPEHSCTRRTCCTRRTRCTRCTRRHPRHPQAPDISGGSACRVHRAWRRGGLDASTVAAVRRQRLHVLIDPRGVPDRPGYRRPAGIATGAANAGSAIGAWRRSRRARGGDRVRRLGDRQRAARAGNQRRSSSRTFAPRRHWRLLSMRCGVRSPSCRRPSCGARASR